MKYVLGLGEYGCSELFGSISVSSIYVPISKLPEYRSKYNKFLGSDVDDYTVFDVMKLLFPNYSNKNMVDWLAKSHYYDVDIPDDHFNVGVLNYMTDDPSFTPETLEYMIACVYTPETVRFNGWLKEESVGLVAYQQIYYIEDTLKEEIADIYESAKPGLYSEPPIRIECDTDDDELELDPSDQSIANFLAIVISRASYLAYVQTLERSCNASLPRGISQETFNFYQSRCANMEPEQKKMLFKVSYVENTIGG